MKVFIVGSLGALVVIALSIFLPPGITFALILAVIVGAVAYARSK